MVILDHIQKYAPSLVPKLCLLSYEDKLKNLDLYTCTTGERERGDCVVIRSLKFYQFKKIKSRSFAKKISYKHLKENFGCVVTIDQVYTQGHTCTYILRLHKPSLLKGLMIRNIIYSMKAITLWSSLPDGK